jgi:hypothetical protein
MVIDFESKPAAKLLTQNLYAFRRANLRAFHAEGAFIMVDIGQVILHRNGPLRAGLLADIAAEAALAAVGPDQSAFVK